MGRQSTIDEFLAESHVYPGEPKYIISLDRPGTSTGEMPRGFYRELGKLMKVFGGRIRRIQKSVYVAHGEEPARRLMELARRYGFEVYAARWAV